MSGERGGLYDDNTPSSQEEAEQIELEANVRRAMAVTFDELLVHAEEYGCSHGASSKDPEKIVPWSFYYAGFAVTHENDDCYLITLPTETRRIERLAAPAPVAGPADAPPTVCSCAVFATVYFDPMRRCDRCHGMLPSLPFPRPADAAPEQNGLDAKGRTWGYFRVLGAFEHAETRVTFSPCDECKTLGLDNCKGHEGPPCELILRAASTSENPASPVARPADALDEAFEASLPPDRQFARRDARRIIAELSRPADAVRPPLDDTTGNVELDGLLRYALVLTKRAGELGGCMNASPTDVVRYQNMEKLRAKAVAELRAAIRRASVEAQEDREFLKRELDEVIEIEWLITENPDPESTHQRLVGMVERFKAHLNKGPLSSGLPHAATKPAPENA